MKIKNNKGATHVGVILSLVIFVGFLIFLYTVVTPGVQTQKNKQLATDYLKIKLQEEFSANLTAVTITATYSSGADQCLQVDNLALGLENLNIVVKDNVGNIIDSEKQGNYLKIALDNADEFFKIYYSEEEFIAQQAPVCLTDITVYNVNSLKTSERIFETKIIDFFSRYEIDYEDLKESLDIPFETGFSFNFTYDNGTVVGPEITERYQELYVEDFSVEYVNREANISAGTLTIMTW